LESLYQESAEVRPGIARVSVNALNNAAAGRHIEEQNQCFHKAI
jgi:hypothetical protein